VTKNLNTVYQQVERQELERQELERQARGGGSQVSGTERGTGRRRRRKVSHDREASEEVVIEREAEEGEEEVEVQGEPSDAREESDGLPPADGSDMEDAEEGGEEGGPEQEVDSSGQWGVPPWSYTAPHLDPSCREAVSCSRRFLVRL
jgi:hypothetical protein